MNNTFDKAWNNILENFDWIKIHKVMEALEWKYVYTDPELTCPSIGTLVKTAQGMCQKAWKLYETNKDLGHASCSTGGFRAEVYLDECGEPQLCLRFVVTEWESYSE